MDSRRWDRYPPWKRIEREIRAAHEAGLPGGTAFAFSFADSVDAPNHEPIGFLDIYRGLPEDRRWKYPDGSPAPDPYTSAVSRSFSGKLVARVLGEEFGRRDIYTVVQPQNPYWSAFLLEWAKKNIDAGADTLFIDNPDGLAPGWLGGWGCSDTWEGQGFQDHLKQRMTAPTLASLGIEDIEDFCLRDYVSRNYGVKGVGSNELRVRETFPIAWPPERVLLDTTDGLMDDPVIKEYILYSYLSVKDFVQRLSRDIRGYAQESGRDVFLTMNGFETWTPESRHSGVIGILLAPYFSGMQIERNTEHLPPYQTDPATCKSGLATVDGETPVWINEWTLWFANPYGPEVPPDDVSALLKTKSAEAFASGCIRLVPFGTGWPADGWPPDRLVNGPERGELARFYRHVDEHRDLLANTESTARVALIYGIPTVVWNHFPTFGLLPEDYKAELGGWARALEMLHIPYDVVLLSMDQVFEHEGLAGRLDRYDVVVAPGAEHVSDKDLEALTKFVNDGGALLTTADFARRDEMNSLRDDSPRSALMTRSDVAVVESGLGSGLQKALEGRLIDTNLLGEMRSILFASIPAEAGVWTNGSELLLVSPVIQREENRLIVHLINYDYGYDANRDWNNVMRDLKIALALPEGFTTSEVRIVTPDDVPMEGLAWTEKNGVVELHVPELELWNMIVLEGR